MRNVYKFLVETLEGKRRLRRVGEDGRDNIKIGQVFFSGLALSSCQCNSTGALFLLMYPMGHGQWAMGTLAAAVPCRHSHNYNNYNFIDFYKTVKSEI
jgi:hypothetical protein